jgi:hypothetical protein
MPNQNAMTTMSATMYITTTSITVPLGVRDSGSKRPAGCAPCASRPARVLALGEAASGVQGACHAYDEVW